MPTYNRRNSDKPDNIISKIGNREYSIIDIENLQEANKQMEKLIKNREKLIQQNGKLSDKTMRDHEMVTKMYKSNLDIIDKWNKSMRKSVANPTDKSDIISSLISSSQSSSKLPKSISDIFSTTISKQLNKDAEEAYSKAAKSVYTKYKRKGADFTDSDVITSMNKEIRDKTLKSIDKSVTKYGKATQVFEVASNTLSSAISTWVGVAKKGYNAQSDAYENTFTNISVRNGVTRSNYYDAKLKLNNRLSAMGVRNNIASSDVQQMWNTMASNGVKIDMSSEKARADVTAKAIEFVLTKEIVPYLDVSSKSTTILNERLDGKFIKDIRGISQANLQIADNNFLTQDLLQTIIDQVQPLSDEALQNLTKGSAEFTALINSLIPHMGERAATEYATQIFKMQNYSDQILSSGSTFEKDWLIQTMNSKYNIYNPDDWNNIGGIGIDTAQLYTSWLPGYTSTTNGVITNYGVHGLGLSTDMAMGAYNLTGKGLSGTGFANLSDLSPEQYAAITNAVTDSFKNDQNQTNQRLQDVTMENLMNELSVFNDWFGHWTDVIVTAIKGIGTILLTKVIGGVIGKGIGALSGIGGGLSSVAGLGAALGPLGAIAAGVGIAAVAANKIANKKFENAEGYGSSYNNLYNQSIANQKEHGATDSTVDKIQAMVDAANGMGKQDNGQLFGQSTRMISLLGEDQVSDFSAPMGSGPLAQNNMLEVFDFVDKETREKYGLKPNALQHGSTEAKKALDRMASSGDNTGYNRIKTVALGSVLSKNEKLFTGPEVTAALNADLLLHGLQDDEAMTGPISEILNVPIISDKETLKQFMEKANITKASQLNKVYNLFKLRTIDYYLRSSGGNYHAYPDTEKLKAEFNLHRYGLGYVPYDEYPALLHQGEAVLTATTANTLRDLLTEYQQTRQETINFDTVIQTQTAALVNKMNEIINVIEAGNGSNFAVPRDTLKAKGLITSSMTHMSSTKNF